MASALEAVEVSWDAKRNTTFEFVRQLADSPTAGLPGRLRESDLSFGAALLSSLTLDAATKKVVVFVGQAAPLVHRKALVHSLSISQFLFAQHHHPEAVLSFHALFVSRDGKEAEVAKANQARYHPAQLVEAFTLTDDALVAALRLYETSFLESREAARDFARLQLLARSPTPHDSVLPGLLGEPVEHRPSYFIKGPGGSLLRSAGSRTAPSPAAAPSTTVAEAVSPPATSPTATGRAATSRAASSAAVSSDPREVSLDDADFSGDVADSFVQFTGAISGGLGAIPRMSEMKGLSIDSLPMPSFEMSSAMPSLPTSLPGFGGFSWSAASSTGSAEPGTQI